VELNLSHQAAGYRRRRKQVSIWKKITMILASVVVFCTTYALILPAITMEQAAICGKEEHLHDETCYTVAPSVAVTQLFCDRDTLALHSHDESCLNETGRPVCGYADFVLHRHDAVCYDGDGRLQCALPEIEAHTHGASCWQQPHIHSDGCYTSVQGELLCAMMEGQIHAHLETCYTSRQALICTQPEVVGHTHGDACRTVTATLTCQLTEEEAHAHDDACLDENGALVCVRPVTTGHAHNDACYETTETMTCALPEQEGHTHGDGCYQTVYDLACALSDTEPHVHGSACYLWTPQLTCQERTAEDGAQPILICAQEEIVAHTHQDSCFADGVLTCGLTEVLTHVHSADDCYQIIIQDSQQQVLSCGMEEHSHEESCYPIEDTKNESFVGDGFIDIRYCGIAAHSHGESCYDANGVQLCTMMVHEHDWRCDLLPSDPTAVETPEDWEADLPDLQGNMAADLIAVAESQLGYEQVEENYIIQGDEQLFYSRYADWWSYGEDPYGDWNAKFVSFCLEYAGSGFPSYADADEWTRALKGSECCLSEEELPIPADLVFLTNDRMGVVTAVDAENGTLDAILEWNGKVREKTFELNEDVLLTVRLPGNEPVVTVEPLPGEIVMPSIFTYEDEWLSMVLTVDGVASLPEGAVLPEDVLLPEPVLTVQMLDDESDLYWQLFEAAQEHGEEGGLLGLTAMELQFWYGEYLLDTTACAMTAQITLKETLLAPPMQTYSLRAAVPTPAPEAETGVEVAVIQADGTAITGTDTAFFETGAPSPTMTFAVTNNVIAVATSQTANPRFTVQYYAYVDQFILSDSGTLDVINTDNGGVNQGGIMPQNGGTILKKYLTLNADGTVADQSVLTRVYKDYQYQYIEAPNLTYFNRLFENGHYRLTNVWILKDGKSASSTTESDWNVYPADTHFTNRPENATQTGAILIEEGTVIRLIYEVTDGSYNNDTNFFDYDITDGTIYSSYSTDTKAFGSKVTSTSATGSYYTQTDTPAGSGGTRGINLPGNYSGSGAKLAFGNDNTRVGLASQTWTDKNGVSNQLNQYNRSANSSNGAKGCTFGLANYLTTAGNIVFSSGVTAPNLFGEGAPTGRTYFNGYELFFQREGDTYTLSKVLNSSGGAVLSDLNSFANPHSNYPNIWSNDFWPMDNVYPYVNNYVSGHDMKFGGSNGTKTIGVGAVKSGSHTEQFPTSDDFLFHNSYFGMQYAVNFELTADYVGPLEYLFFGDDDMWVFLSPADENGNITGNGTLVCDIGGVHSSVGQYVNLWDYIDRENRTADQNYVLSFFYTERGASGSSCYMQFTLPSVSSATPEQTTGTLRVEKEVSGAAVDLEQEYRFTINFTDEKGALLQDDYAYTRHSSDGEIIGRDVIISTGGEFTLKHGEYIIVKYLPVGTKYSITEAEGGYVTTVSINGTIKEDATATGTIQLVKQDTVTYTNTFYYELPETGGGGAMAYRLMGSGMLLLLPILYVAKRRYRGRRVNGG